MEDALTIELLGKALEWDSKCPFRTDHRIVVNRASYDNYKETFKLTDDQMVTMFLVSDYMEIK